MLCFPSIKEFISLRALELKVYTLPQPREFYEDRRRGFALELGGSDVFLLFINDLHLNESKHRMSLIHKASSSFVL